MKLQTKGYITVFLSLSLLIIASLVLALYQGARISAVRMKTECVADIAMNSVLGEYSRELFDQYGLLMVDTSYGTGNHTILNAQEHLKNYAQKNFERSVPGGLLNAQTMTAMYCKDAKITDYSFATDNDAGVFKRQILAYMAAEPVGSLMTDVLDHTSELKEHGFDTTDVEAQAEENQKELDLVEMPVINDENGVPRALSMGNPADEVNSQKSIGILNLAIRDRNKISTALINQDDYVSHRAKNKGTGLDDTEEISSGEKLLLDQYYFEKCSRFDCEKEKSHLKYQLEYLIFGESSDYKNLEKMAQTLLFWREASNLAYLLSCQKKMEEAELLAAALSIIAFMPELKEPIKYSILFAWSFAESVSDINILFDGGRVPLIKTDSTWKLGLMDIFNFREHLNGGDCGEGLYYKDYLRMKLLMTPSEKKTERMMDVIEMDVRRTPGNSLFMLDYCLDVFRAKITVGTRYGYEVKIDRTYGYERY